jgi:hypothetical protein
MNYVTRHCSGEHCGCKTSHSLEFDGFRWAWKCYNCGKLTPRRERKAARAANGRTAAQERAIARIRKDLVAEHYGSTSSDYEVKRFEVTDREHFVTVVAETGLKQDEGTMAAVYCRRRIIVAIGPRGGVQVLNAKRKQGQGWFTVFHGTTY